MKKRLLNLFLVGWEYKMQASFLEIYNEQIRDLLGNGGNSVHEVRMVPNTSLVTVTDLTISASKTESFIRFIHICPFHSARAGGPRGV